MMQNCRYEVRGTMALAYEDRREETNLIDYDIARRSYEARRRLAQRQQRAAAEKPVTHAHHNRQLSTRRPTLEETVASSYTPDRTTTQMLSDLVSRLGDAVSSHPFVDQLRYGSLRGVETGKATYKQVFSSATVCVVLSALMIFVGA